MTAMRSSTAWSRLVLVALCGLAPMALPAQTAPAAATAAAVPGPGPQELMQQISQDLLRELDANRAAITKDPARLRDILGSKVERRAMRDYESILSAGGDWSRIGILR